jgi:Tfp pilus assembly protein PilN
MRLRRKGGVDSTTKQPRPEKGRSRRGPATPGLPSANLLSPSAFERLATRRLRRRFLAAGGVLVVVVAALWGVQHLRVAEAEQLLTVEQAETARLTQETQALLPVRAFVTGVQQQVTTVSETMAREIYFSTVLEGLQDAAPSGVQIDSVSAILAPAPVEPPAPAPTEGAEGADEGEEAEGAEQPAPAPAPAPQVSPCPGPDPFNTRTVVGCITLSGSADSRAEVGDLVINLGADSLFVEPFISTTTTGDEARVTFSGSVGLSEEVFSGRYADLEALLSGEGDR